MSLRITIDEVRPVGYWTWGMSEDCCGICRIAFDACCPDCSEPGDSCPPVWGSCRHFFHLHCILKWIESQNTENAQCPMCRRPWEFNSAMDD